MTTDSIAPTADKRDAEQFLAGWIGLAVCGLVAAVLWFFAIKSVWSDGSVEAASLDCAATYGISEDAEPCAQP